jgi:hypothetical protein
LTVYRLHSFRIFADQAGLAAIESREFDEFRDYIGSAPGVDAPLYVFKEEHGHRCPSNLNVTGVELVYNPAEADVVKKTDRLNRILTSFGNAPDLAAIPEEGYIHATRAAAVRDGLSESKTYWEDYHQRMTALEGADADRSSFTLERLPSNPGAELPDQALSALQSLDNVYQAKINCGRILGSLDGATPAKGTIEAAFAVLNEAADMFQKADDDLQQFRPDNLKYLCKPGTRKKQEAAWNPEECKVGDIVLVSVEPSNNADGRAWDVGVILDPQSTNVRGGNDRPSGLHVPAGRPGREKVR